MSSDGAKKFHNSDCSHFVINGPSYKRSIIVNYDFSHTADNFPFSVRLPSIVTYNGGAFTRLATGEGVMQV